MSASGHTPLQFPAMSATSRVKVSATGAVRHARYPCRGLCPSDWAMESRDDGESPRRGKSGIE
jgi:hypothetical protein